MVVAVKYFQINFIFRAFISISRTVVSIRLRDVLSDQYSVHMCKPILSDQKLKS